MPKSLIVTDENGLEGNGVRGDLQVVPTDGSAFRFLVGTDVPVRFRRREIPWADRNFGQEKIDRFPPLWAWIKPCQSIKNLAGADS